MYNLWYLQHSLVKLPIANCIWSQKMSSDLNLPLNSFSRRSVVHSVKERVVRSNHSLTLSLSFIHSFPTFSPTEGLDWDLRLKLVAEVDCYGF